MARLFNDASDEYLGYVGAIVASAPVSIAAWFYSDSSTDPQFLVSITDYSGGANGDFLGLQINGNIAGDPIRAVSFNGTSTVAAETSSGYSINTWHHGCAVHASTTDRRIYLDGGSKGTNTTGNTPSDLSHTAIGHLWRTDNFQGHMSGRIAEVAVWNVVLSDDEVALLAQRLCPLFIQPQNIVVYYPLMRDDNDRIGGYNMTAYNTPTWADHPPIFYPAPPRIIHIPAAGPVVGGALQMWPRFF